MRVSIRMGGLAAAMLLWMACASGGGNPGGESAASTVDVRIGAEATEASSHDITVEALNGGRVEYSVEDTMGRVFKVVLDPTQAQDLLDGSTVMAHGTDTDGKSEPIRIGVNKASKQQSFGW